MNKTTLRNISLIISLLAIPSLLMADKICNFRLQNCPETFNGKTIYVPSNVTSIASEFKVCMPLTSIQNNSGTPPSIVFIIDNSPSMMGSSSITGIDLEGSRFLVTKALLDTINKTFPNAEVGVVVFDNKLFFNADDDSMFKRMPDDFNVPQGIKSQAYVPLMQLDKTQKNGIKGIDYLKYILQTKKIPLSARRGDTTWTTDLLYKPSKYTDHSGTHINIAFEAAKEAMKASSYAKENQYIVFLSDGDANTTTSPMAENYFERGINVPTTFTVYFTENATGSAPQRLQTMTSNIKANNYSSSNPSSQLWTIQTDFNALMNLAMKNIFNPLILNIKQTPTTLTINSKSYTKITDSSTFDLGESLKLNDSLTHFDISVKYRVKDDSLKIQKDTSLSISFNVVRSDAKAMSDGILVDCSDTVYYTISVLATDAFAKEKNAKPGTIAFSRNNTKGSVTVYFSKSGTATYKNDYTLSALDSVTFKDGEKTVTDTVTPVDDTIIEPTETVILTILEKSNTRNIRYKIDKNQPSATITIEDSYVPPPDTLTVTITPNPFTRGTNERFSENVKTFFSNVIDGKSGMLIAVYSTAKLQKVPGMEDEYGTGYIYDAVGNLINTIKMKKANDNLSDSTNYGFLWDCTNSNQRIVGIGTYLIKIKLKETNGRERIFTRKLGVKNTGFSNVKTQ